MSDTTATGQERTKAMNDTPQSNSGPRCSDSMFGYGIGNCAGCNRFPVVLYKAPRANTWRCETCYSSDYGGQPANLVTT